MNDLDLFRATLRGEPSAESGTLNIDRIVAIGDGIRRRRRIRALSVGVAAVLAAVLGTVVVYRQAGPAVNRNHRPPAASGRPSMATQPPQPPQPSQSSPAPNRPRSGLLGEIVPTGLKSSQGRIAIYATAFARDDKPQITFRLHAGIVDDSGHVVDDGVIDEETEGSDRSPGFHAVNRGWYVGKRVLPPFGYYVGPAARITVQVDGKTVTAGQARWSEDPNVVFWWFDPFHDVSAAAHLTGLAAYDSAGNRLPGTSGFGAG